MPDIVLSYKRVTEGGRFFAVSAARRWNNVPLNARKFNLHKTIYIKRSSQRNNVWTILGFNVLNLVLL